jgi:RNA polymerase sigma factor (sigma-70 family)
MRREDGINNFREVYNRVFPVLIRIAFHITGDQTISEDLCQEAFIKYYQRMIPFPDVDQAKYWLIRVVKNLALNFEKRKIRERKAYTKVLQTAERHEPSGEIVAVKKETLRVVQDALQKLPYNLRSVLVLREYGQLNYKEIAGILGISEGNVKVRIFRAREVLGRIIKESNYVP